MNNTTTITKSLFPFYELLTPDNITNITNITNIVYNVLECSKSKETMIFYLTIAILCAIVSSILAAITHIYVFKWKHNIRRTSESEPTHIA
jgi:hypothetical protein